jgi:hypothetical protein
MGNALPRRTWMNPLLLTSKINIWDHNNDEIDEIDENASHDDYTRVSI